jgi:hypothetical protein
MRPALIAFCLFVLSGVAIASDTFRFSGGVVSVGDSIAALVQRAGKPDRTVQLENAYGGGVGERWEYYLPGGKLVMFTIRGSRVVAIDED